MQHAMTKINTSTQPPPALKPVFSLPLKLTIRTARQWSGFLFRILQRQSNGPSFNNLGRSHIGKSVVRNKVAPTRN